MRRVIPTTDGALIEIMEGALRRPPPPEKPKPKKKKRKKRKLIAMALPGFGAWRAQKCHENRDYDLSHKPVGVANGYTMAETTALVEKARARARRDMEQIKKKIVLTDVAEEALLEVITVMRGPHPHTKLQAAKTLLDFTMAKPVAKSEVTVNAAEKWLESLTDDEEA